MQVENETMTSNQATTSSIVLSDEQQYAVDATLSGSNLLILGKAGVGKSTMLNVLQDRLSEAGIAHIVLAPTGVAAINVGGMTIHKMIQLLERRKLKKEAENFTTLLIDEVSMVRADLLDDLDAQMRSYFYQPDLAFAGRQVVLIGDPGQLPPVVNARNEPEVVENLNKNYHSPFFFSSFAYSEGAFHVIELTKIFRQKSERYAKLLNLIRRGTTETVVNYLNTAHTTSSPDGIVLTTTNQLAAQINSLELSKIQAPLHISRAKEFAVDFSNTWKDSELPAERSLELKVGAKVILTKNIYRHPITKTHPDIEEPGRKDNQRFADLEELEIYLSNGDVGEIREIDANPKSSQEYAIVYIPRLDEEVYIAKDVDGTWYKYEITGFEERSLATASGAKVKMNSGKPKKEVVATFTQFPFRLAYAITVHKSQGQTIDSNFTVDLRRPMFAEGQLYVALSRGTDLNNLKIWGKVRESDVKISKAVVDFLKHKNFSRFVGVKDDSSFAKALKALEDIRLAEQSPEALEAREKQKASLESLIDSINDPDDLPPSAA